MEVYIVNKLQFFMTCDFFNEQYILLFILVVIFQLKQPIHYKYLMFFYQTIRLKLILLIQNKIFLTLL